MGELREGGLHALHSLYRRQAKSSGACIISSCPNIHQKLSQEKLSTALQELQHQQTVDSNTAGPQTRLPQTVRLRGEFPPSKDSSLNQSAAPANDVCSPAASALVRLPRRG
jgi:hypothetical protein